MNHPNPTSPKKLPAFNEYGAIGSLLFGALCWGIIWLPYRILAQAGVAGVAASLYTYAMVIVFAGLYSLKHWRGILNLPLNFLWLSIAAGWTNLAYVLAVIDGEVMRVMLLFYLSPIWTLLLAHVWLKERTNTRGLMIIASSLVGAFIMLIDFSGKTSAWPLPKNTAEWLAMSSGIAFSFSNVITRKSTHLSVRKKSFAVWTGVIVIGLILMPLVNEVFPAPAMLAPQQWLLLFITALLILTITVLVQFGVTQISATRASVLFLFELVVAAIASYYLANEVMTWNEWVGGGLIIVAGLFAAFNHSDQ